MASIWEAMAMAQREDGVDGYDLIVKEGNPVLSLDEREEGDKEDEED